MSAHRLDPSRVIAGLDPAIHAAIAAASAHRLDPSRVIAGLDPAIHAAIAAASAHGLDPSRVIAGLDPAIHAADAAAMKRYAVYILASRRNGTLYIGVTSRLADRIYQHREGLVEGFTKRYGVKRLVHCEPFDDVRTAIQREKNLKKWPRAWKIALIEKRNPEWRDLFEDLVG